jgi:hypothetical protein
VKNKQRNLVAMLESHNESPPAKAALRSMLDEKSSAVSQGIFNIYINSSHVDGIHIVVVYLLRGPWVSFCKLPTVI